MGSSKRLSVTQRTPTSLTLPFINTHSKPLYGCHCTFVLPSKVPLSHLSAIISFFRNITRTNKVKHFCEREGGGIGEEGGWGEDGSAHSQRAGEEESKERERERQSRALVDAHRHSHTFAGGRLESGCVYCLSLFVDVVFESRPDLEVAAAAAAAAKGRCPAAPSEPPECRVSHCPQMHHKLPPESLWLG